MFGWQLRFRIRRDWAVRNPGWKTLEVGCFKITESPYDGAQLRAGRNYRGFRFRMNFWLPVEIANWR